ncbi:hypothetical protein HGH93_21475 [Chitinophaga polysaccharea]|uniref:hypothetical protein n=1 Tax=Chitinophaga polysaccharea TaxID=1293035 RepID=UPI001455B205|nr:hypothetical protein [Chitinophaga polysaccharea]NLR60695.1 hypothetical protein [Chitinophaga polysaccharea]
MKKLFWIIPFGTLLLNISCTKDNENQRSSSQTAVLARQCTSCNMSGSNNQAMIIYSEHSSDSFLIANLPLEYKVGEKITYDLREPQSGEGPLLCLDFPVLPPKIYITNIKKVE